MPDKGSERHAVRWPVSVMACFAIVIAALALYVLSTGPAFWLMQRERLSYQAHTTYSQPAFWLADHCGSASRQAYRNYLDWWVPYDYGGYPK